MADAALDRGSWSADTGRAQLGRVPARYLRDAIAAGLADRKRGYYDYLLILRFAVVNLVGFGLLGLAHLQGLAATAIQSDQTGICLLIAAVFLVGLGACAGQIWRTSRDLDRARRGEAAEGSELRRYLDKISGHEVGSRAIFAANLRLRLAHRIGFVRGIAGGLVLLGLIGTVIGFIIALSGVDPAGVSDVNSVGPMVSTLIAGMSTALYTTLVGSVLNIWLMINHGLLMGGTIKLAAAVIELGETHADA